MDKNKKMTRGVEILRISKQCIERKIYIVLLLRVIKNSLSFYCVAIRNGVKGKNTLYDSGMLNDINEAYTLYEKTCVDLEKIVKTLQKI